jgi:alkanesulfonate monooxygenase SsuD/methylene tetrahydromethanopterin reductase-like flavin-dependent oxidoreductase (luciferase family)
MGPKSVELAGRFADGWHALMLTKDGLRDRLDDFDHGADLGDRDRSDQEVTVSLTCCVDEDRERARQLVKQHICFYIGGMGTFYRDALARQGYEDLAHDIADNWDDGDREEIVAEFPEDLLDELAVAGTPEECRDRIDEFEAIDGVTSASVSFPRAAEQADIQRTIETLAPEN